MRKYSMIYSVTLANNAVCKNENEVNEAILIIGEAQREIETLENEVNEIMARALNERKEKMDKLKQQIEIQSNSVQAWCEIHRQELCKNGKTAKLTNGKVSWRTRPAKINIEDKDDVLKSIKELELNQMIRVKEEINKQAILANRHLVQYVKGISIETGKEDFIIKPHQVDIK